uniref:Macrophage-expressed gene 1 protein n=1 Tax=Fundulus heteroclitus TaxID=8078 RepID=A0A3Q2PNE0_FUNHE
MPFLSRLNWHNTLLAALTLFQICSSGPMRCPTNWLRQCQASSNISLTALEVLPGGGWDNLRNLDMGRRTRMKSHQVKDSSTTARVRNFLYTVKAYPNFTLDSRFAQQSLKTYQSNIQYSLTQSHGGIPFYPGITLQKWQENTRNNLVAIDRSGFPINYVINSNMFPDLPQATVGKVARTVNKVIDCYYKINTRPGCVDIHSANFNFQANVMIIHVRTQPPTLVSEECTHSVQISPQMQIWFAKHWPRKNIATSDFSCRPPYIPTLLRSEVRLQSYTNNQCHDAPYRCGFLWIFTCHCTECESVHGVQVAQVNTYWCSVNGQVPEKSGYLFGGIYDTSSQNPTTKSNSCPQSFTPVKFLSDGQMICMSNDYEIGTRHSVPFGGLFSCEAANPLSKKQQKCPPKFSQHLATVSDGCEILYCVQSGLFLGGDWVRVGPTKAWKLVKPEEIPELVRKFKAEL